MDDYSAIESVSDQVQRWTLESDDGSGDFNDLHALIEFRAKFSYSQYHPAMRPSLGFLSRLGRWLGRASEEEDRKTMFRLVPEILFFGSEEFVSLYRTAYNQSVLRWLIELEKLTFDDLDLDARMRDALKKTWFCPITDSMHIADFCHVNNLEGSDYRPDWRSLDKFAHPDKIVNYMNDNEMQRIVMLEDFVGTGDQMAGAVKFAATLPVKCDVLVLPLIICPKGCEIGRQLERQHQNVSFWPVLPLPPDMFIMSSPGKDEDELRRLTRDLASRLHKIVCCGASVDPLGYGRTGALVVMYTNCPDNTLPIINFESELWSPLFPRCSRM